MQLLLAAWEPTKLLTSNKARDTSALPGLLLLRRGWKGCSASVRAWRACSLPPSAGTRPPFARRSAAGGSWRRCVLMLVSRL